MKKTVSKRRYQVRKGYLISPGAAYVLRCAIEKMADAADAEKEALLLTAVITQAITDLSCKPAGDNNTCPQRIMWDAWAFLMTDRIKPFCAAIGLDVDQIRSMVFEAVGNHAHVANCVLIDVLARNTYLTKSEDLDDAA